MVPNYSDPPPVEAIRDLLGICRALWAAAKAEGAGERRLAEIEAAGKDLKLAIGMAQKTSAGSVGHRRAWATCRAGLRTAACAGHRHNGALARDRGGCGTSPRSDPDGGRRSGGAAARGADEALSTTMALEPALAAAR